MKYYFIFILLLVGKLVAFAQEEVILSIDNEKITSQEFLRFYKKNDKLLAGQENRLTPKQYMQLFIDYKLKVIEAQELKMDTSKSFKDELDAYKNQLLQPFLTYNNVTEEKIKAIYDRTTKEVDASHILFLLPRGITPAQEDSIYQKAIEVRKMLIAGEDFARTAVQYSQDPSVKRNSGHLGYFTAFQMVAPFEDAAFSTPIDSISMPVKTRFGYHLVKVHDIRKNRGQVQVAHIFKKFPPKATKEEKELLKNEIEHIKQLIEQGNEFDSIVSSYSDDKRSAANKGILSPFYAYQMPKEFSEQAFALQDSGEISEPFATAYGYHIIKKIKSIPIPSYEASKDMIKKRLKENPHFQEENRRIFIDGLKQDNDYQANVNLVKEAIYKQSLPSNEMLFQLAGKGFSSNAFQNYLSRSHQTDISLENFNKWVDYEIIQWKKEQLLTHDETIKNTVEEYHDGILLFNMMKKNIWDFAANDSTGLEQFYKKNRDRYVWENRFNGVLITCDNEKICEQVQRDLKENKTIEQLQTKYNAEKPQITITEGKWCQNDNPMIDYLVFKKPNNNLIDITKVIVDGKIIKKEVKSLEEAKGAHIADYQDYLEKEWIEELRSKHTIWINQAVLNSISDNE